MYNVNHIVSKYRKRRIKVFHMHLFHFITLQAEKRKVKEMYTIIYNLVLLDCKMYDSLCIFFYEIKGVHFRVHTGKAGCQNIHALCSSLQI